MRFLTATPLWRLSLGNPIFVRVVETAARRKRHTAIRIGYLSLLTAVAIVVTLTSLTRGTLTELSQRSAQLFATISFLQLAMACLLSPIFTAGAITQEKDNQTYGVLLTTPLSNAQIVLGSLCSRLFFVISLLAAGIPIFLMTQLFGGVLTRSILLSFMIAAATAVLTGAIAVAIAVVRVGTGRTIFSFYMMISLYLAGIWAFWSLADRGLLGGVAPEALVALHPFLSLTVVLNMLPAPLPVDVPAAGGLARLWLCSPHYAYLLWTLGVSAAMVLLAALFCRFSHARTRIGWKRVVGAWLRGRQTTRTPRTVWRNPVAWREAATRASAGGKGLMRWLFLVGGLTVGVVLATNYASGAMHPETARDILAPLLWVELTIVLLVLCNVSASAITREREDGTLDLLMVTPVTSRYYVWGKLRGLISFAGVLLIVPVATAAMFAAVNPFRPAPPVPAGPVGQGIVVQIMPPEGVLILAVSMLSYCSLAVMIALTTSLKVKRSINAVISSVFVVGATAVGIGACGTVSLTAVPVLGPLLAMASPYVAIALAVMPHKVAGALVRESPGLNYRLLLTVHAAVGAGMCTALVYGLYSSMVKTFDVTIRSQNQ